MIWNHVQKNAHDVNHVQKNSHDLNHVQKNVQDRVTEEKVGIASHSTCQLSFCLRTVEETYWWDYYQLLIV
jgi:hypothetical protein